MRRIRVTLVDSDAISPKYACSSSAFPRMPNGGDDSGFPDMSRRKLLRPSLSWLSSGIVVIKFCDKSTSVRDGCIARTSPRATPSSRLFEASLRLSNVVFWPSPRAKAVPTSTPRRFSDKSNAVTVVHTARASAMHTAPLRSALRLRSRLKPCHAEGRCFSASPKTDPSSDPRPFLDASRAVSARLTLRA
eukprot:scaffold35023_cov71-Phaeocystis_antarctica.AAC.5